MVELYNMSPTDSSHELVSVFELNMTFTIKLNVYKYLNLLALNCCDI